MKSLSKLILPLAFFALSSNSNSQDFLPGKFKGYQKRNPVPDYSSGYYFGNSGSNLMRVDYYDLDSPKDSIFDVVEFTPLKIRGDSVTRSQFPIIYIFNKYGKQDPPKDDLLLLFDPEMDGINGNEALSPEEYYKDLEIKL